MKKLLLFLSIFAFLNISNIKSAGKSDAVAAIAVQPEIKESIESKAEIKESVESEFRKILREKTPLPEVLFKVIQDYCQKFAHFQTLDVSLAGYQDGVNFVKYLPNESLVSCSSGKTIKIWIKDAATGLWKHFQTLEDADGGHIGFVNFVKYLPDDESLVSCSYDRTIKIWVKNAVGLWELSQTLNDTNGGHTNAVNFVEYFPDELLPDESRSRRPLLVSCSDDSTIKIWIKDAATGLWQHFQTLDHTNGGHINAVNFVKYFHDKSEPQRPLLISGSDDRTIKIWIKDAATGLWQHFQTLDHTKGGHTNAVRFVKYLPDGSLVSCSDGAIKIWIKDSATGLWKHAQTLDHNYWHYVNFVKYLPDGSLILCSNNGIRICIKDAAGIWQYSQTLDYAKIFRFVKYLPNGSLVSCSGSTIKIWSKNAEGLWTHAQTLKGHVDLINLIRHLPDGSLVSCSDDGKIKIWKLTADFSK